MWILPSRFIGPITLAFFILGCFADSDRVTDALMETDGDGLETGEKLIEGLGDTDGMGDGEDDAGRR